MKIYDISREISTKTAEWPGDVKFSYQQIANLNNGDAVNLTAFTMSPHLGTHVDAPWHYSHDGEHPASLSLDRFIGLAQVITITSDTHLITREHIQANYQSGISRLLLRTSHSSVPDDQFREGFQGIDPTLIDWLADEGVMLLGVDTPSIDPAISETLLAHHQAGIRSVTILENLQLGVVPDGIYDLIALPLKFTDICASPIRAVLIARD